MADAKLKLSIITALDNVGLKATKEQVAQLENQLKNVAGKTKNVEPAFKETFNKAFDYIKWAAGGVALFWAAGPKLFKFFEDVTNNSKGMAEGVKDAFSNMAEDIVGATLEHFGVFNELNNATETFKKGLDQQINGIDNLVAGTAKLQDNLANNLNTFEHMSGVVAKVEDSVDNINTHANSLQQSAFNDYLEDVGATQEEKNIANALFKVDDAAEKQRQAVQTRNRKLDIIDTQIDAAQKDAEMQEELVNKLKTQLSNAKQNEKFVSSQNVEMPKLSMWDRFMEGGIVNMIPFVGDFTEGFGKKALEKIQKEQTEAAVKNRRAIEERLQKAQDKLKNKTTAIDKLEAARVGIDAETSRDVINASNDVRFQVSRYDRLAKIQDPTLMAGVDWNYNESVIGSALEKLDFDIPNQHLERIEENTRELSELKNYLQELISMK